VFRFQLYGYQENKEMKSAPVVINVE